MKHNRKWRILVLFVTLIALTAGCAPAPTPVPVPTLIPTPMPIPVPTLVPTPTPIPDDRSFGESAQLGEGTVQVWARLDKDENPIAIGVRFTEGVLSGLSVSDKSLPLALPANTSKTLFTHALFDWNPYGHPPKDYYGAPHFDVHFYLISDSARMDIRQGPDSQNPQPANIPSDYVPTDRPAFSRGMMGTHWSDGHAPEYTGGIFAQTFIYGYSGGQLVFFEPMMTKAYLETKPNLTQDIKQPKSFGKSGFYPTKYSIKYDARNREYSVTLESFVKR